METLQEQTISPRLDEPSGATRRPSPLTLLGIAVAVIVMAALIVSLIGWSSQDGKAHRLQNLESLRASAIKAADAYGVAFGSYNYTDLHGASAPWTVIEDHATARFLADYKKTSAALEPTIKSYKATAKATVPESAASSVSSSKAVVLMLLNQTITNSTQKSGPQSQNFIVVMTLLRQKGQWLIDDVQATV